jgi:hypothetical protein
LPWILLVIELDVGSKYVVVIPLDADQLLRDVLAVVIWNLDVSAPHDNIHATSSYLAAPARLSSPCAQPRSDLAGVSMTIALVPIFGWSDER